MPSTWAHRGDASRNGEVDFADFLRLAANFGKAVDAVWEDGDFNGDGAVGFGDFLALAGNFGEVTLTKEANIGPFTLVGVTLVPGRAGVQSLSGLPSWDQPSSLPRDAYPGIKLLERASSGAPFGPKWGVWIVL